MAASGSTESPSVRKRSTWIVSGTAFASSDGTVTEVNDDVVASPDLVNSDPFGAGWLVKVRFEALPTLLSHDEYVALVGE